MVVSLIIFLILDKVSCSTTIAVKLLQTNKKTNKLNILLMDTITITLYYYQLNILLSFVELIQNTTIEERVSILEAQVVEIEEDITGFEVDLVELEGDVNFLFDETVIQDERIFTLEQTTDAINVQLVTVDDEIESKFSCFFCSWMVGFS